MQDSILVQVSKCHRFQIIHALLAHEFPYHYTMIIKQNVWYYIIAPC